jgi:hypothetical protein
MSNLAIYNDQNIQDKIVTIRGAQVMLDRDLAALYGVETKVFNQAVKRNLNRFPGGYRFQLENNEKNELVTNCDRFEPLKHSTALPYVFTEQGVSMLSVVLRSDVAVEMSIKIIDSFVAMRKFISQNASIFQKIESIEKRQVSYEIKNDTKVDAILNAIEQKQTPQKQHIFYDGQIFDAYIFVSDIVKSAKKSIKLIDNYIDETTLILFTKRVAGVQATFYTKTISKKLQLDLKKHNAQYPEIEIKAFSLSHDRFLIVDDNKVYHIGASLKDLGKKWFAVSKMDINSFELLGKLK